MKNLKKKITIGVIGLLVVSCVAVGTWLMCKDRYEYNDVKWDTAETLLRKRINSAQMIEYYDRKSGSKLFFPDFFVITDTKEDSTVCFHYPDEPHKELMFEFFVTPNVDRWSIQDAISELTDSVTECIMEDKDFFILSGEFDASYHIMFIEKCYLIDDEWFDFTFYYLPKHKPAVDRLIKLIKEWNPYPDRGMLDV